jgi:hypothetical protein
MMHDVRAATVAALLMLGTAHTMPSTCDAPTGSLMVALLSLDLQVEPVFFASSPPADRSDSAECIIAAAVSGDGKPCSRCSRHSPAPTIQAQSAALDIFDGPIVISAPCSDVSSGFVECASVVGSVTVDFRAPWVRRHLWYSGTTCCQYPARSFGVQSAVLESFEESAVICTSSSQCLASGAVDSASVNIFCTDARGACRHPWHSVVIGYRPPVCPSGVQPAVLGLYGKPAMTFVLSLQCSIVDAVDSTLFKVDCDAPGVRRHHWHSRAMCSPTHQPGVIGTGNESIHLFTSQLLFSNLATQVQYAILQVSAASTDSPGSQYSPSLHTSVSTSMGGCWHGTPYHPSAWWIQALAANAGVARAGSIYAQHRHLLKVAVLHVPSVGRAPALLVS